MSGQSSALLRCKNLIHIREKLSQSLRGLVGQLQMRDTRSFQRSSIDGVLGQRLDGLRVSGLQLRVHRQKIVYGLLHQWCDLCFLRIRGIDLNV